MNKLWPISTPCRVSLHIKRMLVSRGPATAGGAFAFLCSAILVLCQISLPTAYLDIAELA